MNHQILWPKGWVKPFTELVGHASRNNQFIGYSYKGERDKPDLFRQSINKSLNQIGKEVNLKYDVSSATKVDLGQYLWETPQYRVNLMSSVKTDSVYVRLWIEEYIPAIGDLR